MANLIKFTDTSTFAGFRGGSVVRKAAADTGDAGDTGLTSGLGRPVGEGNGNLLQCCCLRSPMGGGAWWATVPGVAKTQTRLSD